MHQLDTKPCNAETDAQPNSGYLPKQDLLVRTATPEDGKFLATIYNEAIRSGCSTMDVVPVETTYFTKLLDGFTTREALLVVEHHSTVVAWGIVKRYSDRPGYSYACETSAFVTESYHGCGVGTVLQAAVIQKARAFGYKHLVVKIVAVNKTSIRFHHRFDYEIVGTQREIGFLNGTWHDVVIMQRILNDVQPTGRTL